MPRTIAFFLSDFQSGGTEWFALRLARGLRTRGHKPIFCALRAEGPLLPLAQAEFPVVLLGGGGYRFWGVARALPALVRFLWAHRPHAFISGLPLLNLAAAFAVRLGRARPRLILVEHMRLWVRDLKGPSFKHRLKTWMIGKTYRLADRVVAVSQTAAADLALVAGLPLAAITVIPNPIVPDDIDALAAAPAPHPWLETTRSLPTLLAIGRLLPVKDYPTLLHAFARLRQKTPARLVILGEGCERGAIEDLVRTLGLEDSVALPGACENVFAALARADAFVLSSTSESFGNVLVEALACGTPCVSTASGGPSEILDDGRLGQLVPPGDPERLAEALSATLAAPPPAQALKSAGRRYSVTAAVEAYLKLVE